MDCESVEFRGGRALKDPGGDDKNDSRVAQEIVGVYSWVGCR